MLLYYLRSTTYLINMGVQKKTRKFAEYVPPEPIHICGIQLMLLIDRVKRVIGKKDARRKENVKKNEEALEAQKKRAKDGELVREVPQMPSHFFFQSNSALVPPYSILVDSSFFSRSVQMKLPILETFMDCLYASCQVLVTDCKWSPWRTTGWAETLSLSLQGKRGSEYGWLLIMSICS